MTESERYLHEAHTKEITGQRAVLMGVATAAVGFAMHETASRDLAWSLGLVAIAVTCWAGSFAAGILHSHAAQGSISANMAQNWAEANGDAKRYHRARALGKVMNRQTGRRYKAQLWFLFAGSISYMLGQSLFILEKHAARVEAAKKMQPQRSGPVKKPVLPVR